VYVRRMYRRLTLEPCLALLDGLEHPLANHPRHTPAFLFANLQEGISEVLRHPSVELHFVPFLEGASAGGRGIGVRSLFDSRAPPSGSLVSSVSDSPEDGGMERLVVASVL